MIDLPGYGFTKGVSKDEVRRWEGMTMDYLTTRSPTTLIKYFIDHLYEFNLIQIGPFC